MMGWGTMSLVQRNSHNRIRSLCFLSFQSPFFEKLDILLQIKIFSQSHEPSHPLCLRNGIVRTSQHLISSLYIHPSHSSHNIPSFICLSISSKFHTTQVSITQLHRNNGISCITTRSLGNSAPPPLPFHTRNPLPRLPMREARSQYL
jgi:hypothetical protein